MFHRSCRMVWTGRNSDTLLFAYHTFSYRHGAYVRGSGRTLVRRTGGRLAGQPQGVKKKYRMPRPSGCFVHSSCPCVLVGKGVFLSNHFTKELELSFGFSTFGRAFWGKLFGTILGLEGGYFVLLPFSHRSGPSCLSLGSIRNPSWVWWLDCYWVGSLDLSFFGNRVSTKPTKSETLCRGIRSNQGGSCFLFWGFGQLRNGFGPYGCGSRKGSCSPRWKQGQHA